MIKEQSYNFNIELTKRIRKYHKAKWYPGKLIRWHLQDENGNSVICEQCGNIANVVKIEIHGRYELNVPICKRHLEELLKLNPGYVVEDLVVYRKEEFYIAWNGTRRRWRYTDESRPRTDKGELSADCYDCGRPYQSAGDCVIPNPVWEQINPTYYQGGGILCASCILDRLHHLGISGVTATLF